MIIARNSQAAATLLLPQKKGG